MKTELIISLFGVCTLSSHHLYQLIVHSGSRVGSELCNTLAQVPVYVGRNEAGQTLSECHLMVI